MELNFVYFYKSQLPSPVLKGISLSYIAQNPSSMTVLKYKVQITLLSKIDKKSVLIIPDFD